MTPRPRAPHEIHTPPVSIGIYEYEGAARNQQRGHDMTIERAIVICILVLLLLFVAERVL